MVTWLSGNDVGVAEDGSKTAFRKLPSGEVVPAVRKYKLLGTQVDYTVGEKGTCEKAVSRSVTAVRLMSRVGGAERHQGRTRRTVRGPRGNL